MNHNQPQHLRRLLTGSGLQVINLGVCVLVGLLLTPYMITLIGDRLYGIWVLVAALIGWYGLLDLGLSGTINRHLTEAFSKKEKATCNAIANTGFFLYCTLAIVTLAVTTGIASSLEFFTGPIKDPCGVTISQILLKGN